MATDTNDSAVEYPDVRGTVESVGDVSLGDIVSVPFKIITRLFDGGVDLVDKVKDNDISPLLGPSAALFGFYIAINGGRIGKTMGCQVQNMLDDNMLVSQLLAFLTIMFFSSLVTAAPTTIEEFFSQFNQSIGLYIVYLMSTKLAKESFVLLIAIISIIFLLRKVSNVDEIKNDPNNVVIVKNISTGLVVFGAFILIFGFASYTGQKLIEYKDRKGTWSWTNFMFGKPSCANDGNKVSYLEGLKRLNPLRDSNQRL